MDFLQISKDIKLIEALSIMSKNQNAYGMAVVIDNKDKFLGIITLGDLSKLLISNSKLLEDKIESHYNKKPIFFTNPISDIEIIEKMKSKSLNQKLRRYIPVLDKDGKVDRLVNTYKVLSKTIDFQGKVTVVGMGFVGITLAIALAKKNQKVIGYDINESIINTLKDGESHVDEPGINSLINNYKDEEKLKFTSSLLNSDSDTYLICVGTPVDFNKKTDNSFLLNCIKDISPFLKNGDLIIIRSTVGIGTTRNIIIPKLEEYTGLKPGKELFVSFSPERTVQGNSLYEIENLPQLVSGYSSICLTKAIDFWRKISNSVIQMDSLESCELAKLANNSYRDLTFAFSNGISQVCDSLQVDAEKLINSINEGYPRSMIPKPSPGVGGYCLTKDPYILAYSDACPEKFRNMINYSREVNNSQIDFMLNHLETFLTNKEYKHQDIHVLIIGLAFKGIPQTNDIRGSNSIDLFNKIKNKVKRVSGFDLALNSKTNIEGLNLVKDFDSLKEIIGSTHAIFIMNNNPNNISNDFLNWIRPQTFISDPWCFFRNFDLVRTHNIYYSNLGKLYFKKK